MELTFMVGDAPATVTRSDVTGRCDLRVGSEVRLLASPWRLSTHYELRTRRLWTEQVGGHTIEIEKRRPKLLGGLRANSLTVRVDGVEVASDEGY